MTGHLRPVNIFSVIYMSKRTWIIIIVVILVVIGAIIGLRRLRPKTEAANTTYTAAIGDATSTVEFTGHLEAKQTAKLGFESLGVARQVNVEVGDTVTAGQTLATLDTSSGELEVAKAYADRTSAVATAQAAVDAAQLAATTTGTANQKSVARAEQTVRNAKRDLDQAKAVWEQTVRESGDESSLTQAKYSVVVSSESAYKTAQTTLAETKATADKTNSAATSAITTAQTTLRNTLQASAKSAGPSSLEALEELARLRLSKTVLRAPFNGVVIEKKIASGEVAVAGTGLFTVATTHDLQITADVAETDVTQLQVGQRAEITLDAYPSDQHWSATVTKIAPSAVVLSGVPTYQVTLFLDQADAALKPGLTANIKVTIAHKDQVVLIPRRAVIREEGKDYVFVVTGPKAHDKREVTTGLVDSTGQIEITSGLRAGETIELRPVTTP